MNMMLKLRKDTLLMSSEKLKQLIVLGNGFDLYCGLRSSFNDFFTPRKKQLNKILEENIIRKPDELDNK